MKHAIALALTLGFAASTMADAQTLPGHATACERAWLASDWPTVVVECSNAAASDESDHQTYLNNASVGTADMQNTAREIAWASLVFAGQTRAREAIGYAKLKKVKLFAQAKSQSISDLTDAEPNVQSTLHQKVIDTLQLVQSDSFVKDAPDSDALAHI